MAYNYRYSNTGYYCPTFLSMHLDSPEDFRQILKGRRLTKGAEALFLHEYIHLLQDVTTLNGLGYIAVVVDYMRWATNITKKGAIKVPQIPAQNDGYRLYDNAYLHNIANGSGKINCVYSKTERVYIVDEEFINNGELHRIPLTAILEFTDSLGNLQKYRVGEYCITESMANLIEKNIYPTAIADPDLFPYSVVKLVCDYLVPNFSEDPLRMIALCDGCLMHSFPGKTMVLALENIKSIFHQMSPEDIYDYLISDEFITVAIPGLPNSLMAMFDKYLKQASFQMTGYFTTHNYNNMTKWVNQIFDDAHILRTKKQYFMLEIARGGEIRKNKAFRKVLDSIGCPSIMNSKNELTYIRNNKINFIVTPTTFSAIEQIYKIFVKGNLDQHDTYECKLINWCKKDFEKNKVPDLTAEYQSKCKFCPWERNSTPELKHCYFGQIWLTWGLKDVYPVK